MRSGSRVVPVSKPEAGEAALALTRKNLSRNTVRMGITQNPVGLGIVEAGQSKPEVVKPCRDIRMGTFWPTSFPSL